MSYYLFLQLWLQSDFYLKYLNIGRKEENKEHSEKSCPRATKIRYNLKLKLQLDVSKKNSNWTKEDTMK